MGLGIRAMKFASNVQIDEKYQPASEKKESEAASDSVNQSAFDSSGIDAEGKRHVDMEKVRSANKRIQEGVVAGTMVFSLIFGFMLFNYLPNYIAELTQRGFGVTDERQINLVAEVVKIVIFLAYIAAIGQLKDVKEVFKYHGAEHKAINTLERDADLIIEECKVSSRLHPRCGTSFAIIVLILGLIIFTFVPRYPVTGHQGANAFADVTVRVLIELLVLPFIAGAAYELLRFAGKFRNQGLVNAAFKPGIWSQYLTTREPDEKQIEVALVALQAVINAEDHADGKIPSAIAIESTPIIPTP
jgi:uncharacterized protein YqhQ